MLKLLAVTVVTFVPAGTTVVYAKLQVPILSATPIGLTLFKIKCDIFFILFVYQSDKMAKL
jgi:hypothetical protein